MNGDEDEGAGTGDFNPGDDGDEPGIDSSTSGGSTGGGEDGDCAETSSEANNLPAPADIIIAVDTSGSMGQEAQWTQQNLPGMVQAIAGSGVDAHVVLIANEDMCVPTPLGSGACGCPNGDEALPNYRHVCTGVGSNNALEIIINTYDQWKDSLRPSASKTIVVVSDDDSDMGAAQFTQALQGLDASLVQFKFDAIVSFGDPFDFGGDCFLVSAAEGKVYKQLVSQTGGVSGDLCKQNFAPVFQDISTQVVESSQISCEYNIPEPPEGETINPNEVNVEYRENPQAPPQPLYNVPGGYGDCGANGGWYYDSATAPTKISLCPSTCDMVQVSIDGRVDVLFGCDTLIGPPD